MNFDTTALAILLLMLGAAVALLLVADRRTASAAYESAVSKGGQPQTSHAKRAGEILLIGLWFGLAAGTFHLLEALIQRYGRGFFLFAGPAMLWMIPLAYTTIFAALGAMVAAVARVSPRLGPSRPIFAGFAWLSVFSLLLPFAQLHQAAGAILAAGIAAQVSRVMARQPAHWLAIMWKSGLVVSGLIGVLALGQNAWSAASERSALAGLPPPPSGGAPNVLLVVLDTVRAANLSLYGYERATTPALERWARDGATFDMALSTSPWTLKSHATMFTGLYPSQIRGDFEHPVRADVPMLAEVFRERGYVTGGFVANLLYTSVESGLARGFIHYDDFHVSGRQVLLHSWIAHTPVVRRLATSRSPTDVVQALFPPSVEFGQRSFHNTTYERKSAEITSSFLAWQTAERGRPFFAFLNYFDAHQPYKNPPADVPHFESGEPNLIDTYDREIAYMDREVGRLLDALDRRGELGRTIVIVVGDHGEQFGEHGLTEHANSLYLQLLRVPLVIRYPLRVPRNVRIDTAVTLRDLPATVIDLADLPDRPHVAGVSLARLWNGEGHSWHGSAILAEVERVIRPEPHEPVRYGPMRALFDETFHFIRRGDGDEELYAYRSDSAEMENLRDTPEGERELTRLRDLLSAAVQ